MMSNYLVDRLSRYCCAIELSWPTQSKPNIGKYLSQPNSFEFGSLYALLYHSRQFLLQPSTGSPMSVK